VTKDIITIEQLGQAIDRCNCANPIDDNGKLHPETCLLAEAMGQMIWRKLKSVNLQVFHGDHRYALTKWVFDDNSAPTHSN